MSLADALEEERKAVLAMNNSGQRGGTQHRPVKSMVLDEPNVPSAHQRSKSVSTGSGPGWNQQRPNILVSGPDGLSGGNKSRSTSPNESMYANPYSNHSTTSKPGMGVGLGHPKAGKVEPLPSHRQVMKNQLFNHMGGATPFGGSSAGNVDDVLLRNLDQLMRNGPGASVRSRSANDSSPRHDTTLYPPTAGYRSSSRNGSRTGSRSGSRAGSRNPSPCRSPSRERSIYDEALRVDHDDDDYFDDDDDDDSEDDDEEDDDTDASSEEDEEDGYSKKKKGKWSGLDTSLVSSNALSLLGAMEDERKSVAQSKFRTKSLMDQAIDPAHPPPPSHQDIAAYRRRIVHPHTAFDAAKLIEQDAKLGVAPYTGYKEEVKDAAAAETMALTVSTIASSAGTKRTIRTITRGDLPGLVGTAITTPDPSLEDNATKTGKETAGSPESAEGRVSASDSNGDNAESDPTSAVPSTSVTASVAAALPTPVVLPYRPKAYMVCTDLSPESSYALEWTVGTVLRDGSILYCVCTYEEEDGMRPESAEIERLKAIGEITHNVVKLLKKTRLQVHVVIEVVHCRNAKLMLCEMIDHVSPTLVVVGSRGRSALKGVLLGSFSNYIVGKSSVPVMVARRRLKKSKAHHVNVRQSNNLREGHGGLGLSAAKVD